MKTIIFFFKKPWYLFILFSIFISYCNRSNSGLELNAPEAPQRYSCPYCDLTEKDFSGQDLSGANLSHANLNGANFSNAILKGTILTGANLENANFQNTSFGKAYRINTSFINSNLTKTNFTGASIASSNFQNADITCANFTNTNISKAIFGQNPVFQERKDCQPIFKNTIMSCEFPWAWSYFDCSDAKFPDCDNVDSDEWIKTINKARKENKTAKWTGKKTLASTYQKPRDLSGFTETYLVTKNGQDITDCGSNDQPCRSIQYAINRCSTSNAAVLVQAAQFEINASIQLKNGVSLFGGYNENGSTSLYQSYLSAQYNISIISAISINSSITIDGFIINGAVSTAEVGGWATIYINNSTGIKLNNCHITACKAYKGYDGTPSLFPRYDGHDGEDGGSFSGGDGGGGLASGGKGSDENIGYIEKYKWICTKGNCSSSNGEAGLDGYVAKGAPQGQSEINNGTSTSPPPGEKGKSATDCGEGGKRSPSIIGTFKGYSYWNATIGEAGSDGNWGGGGGGGGGGGSDRWGYDPENIENYYCYGSSGGGGGGAGYPGLGGMPACQGSASFGVYLHQSTLIAGDSLFIIGGLGGLGGVGGAGSDGGNGGKGGAPGPIADCKVQANSGSKGGDGGSASGGAGGGGGSGGPSIALVLDSTSKIIGQPEYFKGTGGAPGKGGKGGANTADCIPQDGEDGVTGFCAITYIY